MTIRCACPDDALAIRSLIGAAFKQAARSSGTEAAIVDALRAAGALTVSLVAVHGGEIVGHVAFSPVTIGGDGLGWCGIGPVSVRPDRRRMGIGQQLIRQGLARLRALGAKGCVVLGDPAYYARFGFASDPDLRFGEVPPRFLQLLTFSSARPQGEVAYHPAFGAR